MSLTVSPSLRSIHMIADTASVSIMDLLPNELLDHILSNLPVTCKFRVMQVSHKWRTLCRVQVAKQKMLAVRSLPSESLFPLTADFVLGDLVSESMVSVRNKHCWPTLMQQMPALTGFYAECEAGLFIRTLLSSCCHTLTCIICPNWTFACDHPLPVLVVLAVDFIPESSLMHLLKQAPKLASLKFSRTSFRRWQLAPAGLLSLTGGELQDQPFDLLFGSAAAASLQLLSLRSQMLQLSRTYHLPLLRQLEVSGNEPLSDNVILNWADTLSGSKQLVSLHFSTPVESHHFSSAALWDTFFTAISTISRIYLNLRCHRIRSMSQIVTSLVNHCAQLQEITLPFSNLNDEDMIVVSRLSHLKKLLLYSNCGPVTEQGVLSLLNGTCAPTLTELHIYCNYKRDKFLPPMCTAATRQRVLELQQQHSLTSATLQYVDWLWQP